VGGGEIFWGPVKAAKDVSGAADPYKSIPCCQGRKNSATDVMNDKLKIKITFVVAEPIFFLLRRSLWQN